MLSWRHLLNSELRRLEFDIGVPNPGRFPCYELRHLDELAYYALAK